MRLPKHNFCRCMKPWKICVNKKNSYKIDVRELINTQDIPTPPNLSQLHLNYDFINKKWLHKRFNCRFKDDDLPPFSKF